MNIEEALEWAAQAWCAKETEDRVVDVDLAKQFARILKRRVEEALLSKEIVAARRVFAEAFALDADFLRTYVDNISMLLHDRHGIDDYDTRQRIASGVLDLIFGRATEVWGKSPLRGGYTHYMKKPDRSHRVPTELMPQLRIPTASMPTPRMPTGGLASEHSPLEREDPVRVPMFALVPGTIKTPYRDEPFLYCLAKYEWDQYLASGRPADVLTLLVACSPRMIRLGECVTQDYVTTQQAERKIDLLNESSYSRRDLAGAFSLLNGGLSPRDIHAPTIEIAREIGGDPSLYIWRWIESSQIALSSF